MLALSYQTAFRVLILNGPPGLFKRPSLRVFAVRVGGWGGLLGGGGLGQYCGAGEAGGGPGGGKQGAQGRALRLRRKRASSKAWHGWGCAWAACRHIGSGGSGFGAGRRAASRAWGRSATLRRAAVRCCVWLTASQGMVASARAAASSCVPPTPHPEGRRAAGRGSLSSARRRTRRRRRRRRIASQLRPCYGRNNDGRDQARLGLGRDCARFLLWSE